jgi:hypothetical protein
MIRPGKKGYSTFVSELGWSEANNSQSCSFPVCSLAARLDVVS